MSIWKGSSWYDASEEFAQPLARLWETVESGDAMRAADLFVKEPQLEHVVDYADESPWGSSSDMLGSPLAAACGKGHEALAAVLLDHGARVDRRTPTGDTPLILAARGGHIETARLLLNRGADPDGRLCSPKEEQSEWTSIWDAEGGPPDLGPIHWAAQRGDEPLVRLLLEKGATCNMPDAQGSTALHHAALNHAAGVAWHLLRAGADLNAINGEGYTAGDIAHGGDNDEGLWRNGTWGEDGLSRVLFQEIGRSFDYITIAEGHDTDVVCPNCQLGCMYAVFIQGENKLVCPVQACGQVESPPSE